MVADWIVIYAGLFVLAAVVVGGIPVEGRAAMPGRGQRPGSRPIDLSLAVPLLHHADFSAGQCGSRIGDRHAG
jgi:hypothetical protein